MNGGSAARLHRNRRTWITVLVVVAMVARALVPTGFMPAAGVGFPIALCPAYGEAASKGNPGTQHPHGPSHQDPGTACAFAVASLASAAPPHVAGAVAVLPAFLPSLRATRRAVAVDVAGPVRAQAARAPPAIYS